MKKKLPVSTILYRDISKKSSDIKQSRSGSYESAMSSIRENRIDYDYIYPYFKDNVNFTNANSSTESCLRILDKLSKSKVVDKSKYDFLLNEFTNYILPYVDNLDLVSNSFTLRNMKDCDKIMESVEQLEQADRILYNFKTINDKHNIIDDMSNNTYRHTDLRTMLENVYNAIQSYDSIKNGPKFNLALECAIYGFTKVGYYFEYDQLVNELTDIVMSRPFSESDLSSYRKVLTNNVLLDESDISGVRYVFETEDFADSNDVHDLIVSYKKQAKKDEGTLKRILVKIYAKSPKNIIDETPNILELIRNCGIIGTLAINPILTLVVFCVDKMIEMNFKENETKKMAKYFKNEKSKVDKKISSTKDKTQKERLEKYSKCLDQCIDKINEYAESIQSDENINDVLDEAMSTPDILRKTANQFLVDRYNTTVSEMKNTMQLLANVLYTSNYKIDRCEESMNDFSDPNNLNRFITADGLIQVPLYRVSGTDNSIVYKEMSGLCADINSQLNGFVLIVNNAIDCVYIIFMDLSPLDISLSDVDTENLDESGMLLLSELMHSMNALLESNKTPDELLDKISTVSYTKPLEESDITLFELGELLLEYTNNPITFDKFYDALEKRKNKSNDCMEIVKYVSMKNRLMDMNISENTISNIKDVLNINEISSMIDSILEDSSNKKDIKDKVDKMKKEKKDLSMKSIKNNINNKKETLSNNVGKMLNNGALAIQGLKKDAQNLSDKEKQVSRDIDMTFSAFRRSIEKSLVSNKRESIIKGSIIPSFSKIMKNAILFAGTYSLINPALAVIGAIGAFALSKSLTTKERQLILDEIEVELNIVEKELSSAEEEKDMKKYRQLLQYQRKLEREYQRIRYNIKVHSRDIAPVIKRD